MSVEKYEQTCIAVRYILNKILVLSEKILLFQ